MLLTYYKVQYISLCTDIHTYVTPSGQPSKYEPHVDNKFCSGEKEGEGETYCMYPYIDKVVVIDRHSSNRTFFVA